MLSVILLSVSGLHVIAPFTTNLSVSISKEKVN